MKEESMRRQNESMRRQMSQRGVNEESKCGNGEANESKKESMRRQMSQ